MFQREFTKEKMSLKMPIGMWRQNFSFLSELYIVFDNSNTIFKLLIVLLICVHEIVDSK